MTLREDDHERLMRECRRLIVENDRLQGIVANLASLADVGTVTIRRLRSGPQLVYVVGCSGWDHTDDPDLGLAIAKRLAAEKARGA